MKTMAYQKYRPFPTVDLPDRKWPNNRLLGAPEWCSVDLRDGNQALVTPMGLPEKLEMFRLLVHVGFRQIEVGFPSASEVEYAFLRHLIDHDLIPEDVTVQVLTQAREHLIRKTFDSLDGAKRAVVHMYNSTSTLQRRVVFRMDRTEIVKLAVAGAEQIRQEASAGTGTQFTYEYSPESFTGTELDYALEICAAVTDAWQATKETKIILNLPATVEMATANVYADQIEWFCRNFPDRDRVVISTHAHNDRGTAVSATELALMAGADRVEGTLFGNGERTGNVDILTLALNLFSQGLDPKLDFSDMTRVVSVYERCTGIPVHVRHPYAGELVYTAFSGSHQDAINKGMKAQADKGSTYWDVPYLPIDPSDVGRTYESVIRINSQSGKGGVAYIMEKHFGFSLPKDMHPEFGRLVQALSDRTGKEVTPQDVRVAFEEEYLLKKNPYAFIGVSGECPLSPRPDSISSAVDLKVRVSIDGQKRELNGAGNGPIDAFSNAIRIEGGTDFVLLAYYEHALTTGSDSRAVAYVHIEGPEKNRAWGVGLDTNINIASFKAILSALNRLARG